MNVYLDFSAFISEPPSSLASNVYSVLFFTFSSNKLTHQHRPDGTEPILSSA